MNKFKLSLFAVIAAGAVGCGGGGGGGDAAGTTSYAPGEVVVDDNIQRHSFIQRDRTDKIKTLAAEEIDFDGDGLLDIAMFRTEQSYANSYVEAYINNGDRTFRFDPNVFASVGNQFRPIMDGIQKADLNADGRLDFVTGSDGCFGDHGGDDCLPPLMSKADGTYEITTHPLLTKLSGGRVDLVDFNNDGDMDLLYNDNIVNGQWMDKVVFNVYENRSENGVAKFVEHADILGNPVNTHGHFVNSVAVIDLNGDGLMDFMWGGGVWDGSTNFFANRTITPGFAYNKGNFKFQKTNDIWLGEKLETYTFYMARVADFDSDGDMDIWQGDTGWDVWDAGYAPGAPDAMLWNVNGKFFVDYGTEDTWGFNGFNHQTDIADIDNDGDMDIVSSYGHTQYNNDFCTAQEGSSWTNNSFWRQLSRVMLNDGTGTFTTSQNYCDTNITLTDEARDRLGIDPYYNRAAATLLLADFDGDGNVDYFQGDLGFADDFIAWGNGSTIEFDNFYSFDGFTPQDVE